MPLNQVTFRDGTKIFLSDHPHDVVTIYAIFIRRDYGKINSQSFVCDIGSNIGVFALYSLLNGASYVHCYEPTSESVVLCRRNLDYNGFADKATVHHLAVLDKDFDDVAIPRQSTVYNKVVSTFDDSSSVDIVKTVKLDTILSSFPGINFLKLDCEGAEYPILDACTSDLSSIRTVALEFHNGSASKLIYFFTSRGFSLSTPMTRLSLESTVGNLIFSKN